MYLAYIYYLKLWWYSFKYNNIPHTSTRNSGDRYTQKICFKTTHSFKRKGVANAKKRLPWLVDNIRAQGSMICCQYPKETKLLFPFPDSASYKLLSEIGEAGLHRSDGISLLIEEKSP